MEIQQPNLGKKIAKLRKAKGLTQEELVEKCNISVRTLQRIEAGEVAPRSYTVKLIFAALGEDVYSYVLDLFNLKTNAMKKLTILSIFFLTICTVIFTACLSNKKALSDEKSLIGTWQITRNGIVDTTYNGQNGLIRYKVITANRFVVTDIMYKQKIMYAAMEGSYTVDQGHKTYSELVENAGNGYTQYMNGKIGTYNYKIVDSLWYIKGNGYDEVWKKVK
jgi:transcriptional regulator with XRE-family HTH domain